MKEFEIVLKELRFFGRHGVLDQETLIGNEFIVDVRVRIPYSDTILDDKLDYTISYADIYTIVEEEMLKPRKLLETVAACICNRLSTTWPQILSGSISICKSTPPIPRITGSSEVRLFF